MIFQNCLKIHSPNGSKYHSWYLCLISLQIMLLPIRIFFKFPRRRGNNRMFIIIPSRKFSSFHSPKKGIFVLFQLQFSSCILLFQPHTRALFHHSNSKIVLIPIIVFFFNPGLSLTISFITVITVTVNI